MAVVKLICAICRNQVQVNLEDLEIFVPDRIWGLKREPKIHYCGHESIFGFDSFPIYSSFLYKKGDKAADLLSKFGLSKWAGKVKFRFLETGTESKDYFKKILRELLEEADSILKNQKIDMPEEKIRLLIQDKLEGYREKIKFGKFEHFRETQFIADHKKDL